MKSYLAHDKKSGLVFAGGLQMVTKWAGERIETAPKAIIAIIQCRPSEGGRVIAEIDIDGGRIIEQGRRLSSSGVSKLSARAVGDG